MKEKLMQKIPLSSSSILGGMAIGFLAVILPVFLLKFTDLAVYAWLPATSLVSLLGGAGLHDRHGILFFLIGALIAFCFYSLMAIGALEFLSRRRKTVGGPDDKS
jgi:hypothetical protein